MAAAKSSAASRPAAAPAHRVAEQCFLIDQLIRVLFDFVSESIYPLANPTAGEKLAIVAVGGYGRGEMAPFSDIDLLFLLPYKRTPHTEQVVEYLLYLLWDLRLKVGHSTRSVDECLRYAKADLTIRTALLEARYVWGEQPLFAELKTRFDAEIVKGSAAQFVEAKLAERDAAPQAGRRQPLPARTQRQGGQGRAARPAHAVLDREIHLPHRRCRKAGRARACCRPRSRSASRAPRASCGRCAATCTISPAAPRSG